MCSQKTSTIEHGPITNVPLTIMPRRVPELETFVSSTNCSRANVFWTSGPR